MVGYFWQLDGFMGRLTEKGGCLFGYSDYTMTIYCSFHARELRHKIGLRRSCLCAFQKMQARMS